MTIRVAINVPTLLLALVPARSSPVPDSRACPDCFTCDYGPPCLSVAAATSLPNHNAAAAVGALFSAIADALARKARNPQTGDVVTIAASRVPTFNASQALREALGYSSA